MPGYDTRTVEPLKKALVCPECNLVLRDAVQTGDGVRLCESCYEQIYQYPNHTSPKSRTVVGEEYYPDKAVRREILQLLVQCISGCPWEGQLQHFEGHCQDCKYKPMRCPNLGCNELMPTDKLDGHVDKECEFRVVACDYCREGTTANQLEEHQNRCPKVPVECERCSEWVVRDELEEHQLRDCPLVKCPGCEEILERNGGEEKHNTIANHLKNPITLFQHMMTLFTHLNVCLQIMGQLQLQFSHLENSILQHTVHPGQLTKVHAEMQRTTKELLEQMAVLEKQNGRGTQDRQASSRTGGARELRPSSRGNFNCLRQQVTTQLSHPIQASTSRDASGVRYYLQPSFATCTPVLIRHNEQQRLPNLEQSLRRQQTASLNSGGLKTRLMELEKRVEELSRQLTALKTHTAQLEMQLQASLANTHNGSFLWRIPDISRRKQDAIDGRITSIYSPPFYTGRNGYKMCVRAYLNGDGSGHTTHLSLFFVLMKGEYDALLKWPFDHKVSMILVDQNCQKHIVQTFKPTPESSSFQRPQTEMNVASGCPQFANLSVLYNNDYVKDDVLYIKCIVDTSRIFHP